jgi:hypothetical protein
LTNISTHGTIANIRKNNMGAFSDSIRKNIDRVLLEVDQKCYAIVYALFTQVVYESPTKPGPPTAPWAKGQFINNWYPAVAGYDTSTTSSTDYEGFGSLSRILELKESQAFYKKDNFVSLSNNLSYANQVESQGWGRTGPYSPVAHAIINYKVPQ